MVKQVKTSAEFEKELKDAGEKVVIVDFTATWCGPCKKMAPIFQALADENSDFVFLKVDVDDCEDVAAKYEVSAMPTFKAFKNGEELKDDMVVGADKNKLEQLIAKYK